MLEIIKHIFRRRWEILYTTHDLDIYYKIKNKLYEERIEHKTKFYAISSRKGMGRNSRTYTILVKVEEAHKAHEVIRNIR